MPQPIPSRAQPPQTVAARDAAARLGPIAATVLAPLWFRAEESARRHRGRTPILVDPWAEEIAAELGIDRRQFGRNIAGSIRARWLDDRVAAHRLQHPGGPVFQLGAGLDAAVHRTQESATGGGPWWDVDLPAVLALRGQTSLAAADASMPGYQSLPLDLTADEGLATLHDAIAATAEPPLILAGGLLYYLPWPIVHRLLAGIADRAPEGTAIAFDTLPPWFIRRTQRPGSTTLGSGRYRWPRMEWGARIRDIPALLAPFRSLRLAAIDDYASTGFRRRWGAIGWVSRLAWVRNRLQGGLVHAFVARDPEPASWSTGQV